MSIGDSILVPLDGSPWAEQVIPVAQALAGQDSHLTLFQAILEAEPLRGIMGSVLATTEDVIGLEVSTAKALLVDTADRWSDIITGDVEIEVAVGDPASAIIETAESGNARMIAIASRGRGALGRLAFGSVADRVARNANTPVLIVHPAQEEPNTKQAAELKRLVVPIDGSDNALQAIPVAVDLSKRTGLPIHLVTAVSATGVIMPSPVGTSMYPAELYKELEGEMQEAAADSQKAARKEIDLPDLSVTQEVVDGTAVDAIESSLANGDVIVMASHGHGGLRRWLLGSVAEKLIRSGLAPVVLVPVAERGDGESA